MLPLRRSPGHASSSRRWAPLLAATVAACASPGGAAPGAGNDVQRVVVGSGHSSSADAELYRERRAVRVGLTAPPDIVYAALATAYAMVGLQGSGPAIGRERTWAAQPRLRMKLDNVRLSQYIDCGRTATGELGADVHMITLTVTSEVTGSGRSSTLATRVLASARAVDNSSSTFECSSTGRLESRINEDVASRVQ